MGQQKAKNKRFFSEHPLCCFCGGSVPATTVDHVPARAFFVDRKSPGCTRFPACLRCQNRTTDSEDIARLLAISQATAINPDALEYFLESEASIMRGFKQRKTKLLDHGESIDGNPVVRLDEDTQERIIEVFRKIALALYYRIVGEILTLDRRMSFGFFNISQREQIANLSKLLKERPVDSDLLEERFVRQFTYRYVWLPRSQIGADLHLGIMLHGFVCFVTFFDSDDDATRNFRKILLSPFETE